MKKKKEKHTHKNQSSELPNTFSVQSVHEEILLFPLEEKMNGVVVKADCLTRDLGL